jgi:tRNA (mo5U34)-methyltransferase
MVLDSHAIARAIDSFAPWFYEFDLGRYGKTTSKLPEDVKRIHTTRLQMVNMALEGHLTPERSGRLSCLDVACHEGFFSIELAKRGVRQVLGIDVREESLQKARFVAQVLDIQNARFQQLNAEEISPEITGEADITLFLGLLYHLENPMMCLRRTAAVTKEVCIVETQVIDEIEGSTEWGAQAWTRDYQGIVALIDENAEFVDKNPETGASPLAMCPSRKGLVTMLKHAGFARVEFVPPPSDAYEQLARGKRVVCAAYKS